MSKEQPSVLKTQSFKQTAIQRTRTPDEALRVLETTGIDPATLLPAGNAAVTLNEATYTAIAEVMLGRLAWDPALRAWRIVAAEPQAVELTPGMAARPAFEEVRAGHLDTMTWLLMGGSYTTITTQGR